MRFPDTPHTSEVAIREYLGQVLASTGQIPTIRELRIHLGGGSLTRLVRIRKAFQLEHGLKRTEEAEGDIPDPIKALLQQTAELLKAINEIAERLDRQHNEIKREIKTINRRLR
jgi:hypothetical protein